MRECKQGLFVYANVQWLSYLPPPTVHPQQLATFCVTALAELLVYLFEWNTHISLGICSHGWTVSAEAKPSVLTYRKEVLEATSKTISQ